LHKTEKENGKQQQKIPFGGGEGGERKCFAMKISRASRWLWMVNAEKAGKRHFKANYLLQANRRSSTKLYTVEDFVLL
jgi:hypothetical protein